MSFNELAEFTTEWRMLIDWLFLIMITGRIAHVLNRSVLRWMFFALILPPIALLIIALIGKPKKEKV